MTTKLTPFEVIYGYPPPRLQTYTTGTTKLQAVEDSLLSHDKFLLLLHDNLHEAQDRTKRFSDLKRTKSEEFHKGDFVYLRLQPYRQHSVVSYNSQKLSPKFYGAYEVLERIRTVAYRLALPLDAQIHLTFHVSSLKKQIGDMQAVIP